MLFFCSKSHVVLITLQTFKDRNKEGGTLKSIKVHKILTISNGLCSFKCVWRAVQKKSVVEKIIDKRVTYLVVIIFGSDKCQVRKDHQIKGVLIK